MVIVGLFHFTALFIKENLKFDLDPAVKPRESKFKTHVCKYKPLVYIYSRDTRTGIKISCLFAY